MAAHLKAQGWEPGSKVAILSKNCAWWMMSDLAIWMAGYVSVPLYPTLAPDTIRQILTHSEAKACFVGKLDGWEHMKPGVPADLPCYQLPAVAARRDQGLRGLGRHLRAHPTAARATRCAAEDELATLIYTSGTTGMPKGVMHSFGNFAWALDKGIKRIPMAGDDRMLSYLPLAHVVERMLVEHGWLRTGMHVYFAESLDTFAADLQRARPTIFFSVPRLWVKFQQGVHHKMPPAKLNRLLGIPILGGTGAQEGDEGPGPGPVQVRRRWRSAHADRAAGVVQQARPADQRGLRHDREPRALAHHRSRARTSRAPWARSTTAWSTASTRKPARSRCAARP